MVLVKQTQSSNRPKYLEYDSDSEFLLQPDDPEYVDGPKAEQLDDFKLSIEKLLGRKFIQVETETSGELTYEELFLIKWKKLSYLHVSWERREDILKVDAHGGKLKIKRFLQSFQLPGIIEEEPWLKKARKEKEEKEEEEGEGEEGEGSNGKNCIIQNLDLIYYLMIEFVC